MSDAINIGLTFYGGVSLAVYEAGVAEEFLRFIQFCRTKGKDVDVRVLSGSSAGGLASIMMSATLVNSSDPANHIENMRRIWFDVADLGRLQYQSNGNIVSFLDNDILEKEIKDFLRIRQESSNPLLREHENLKILITGTNMQGFFDAVPVEDDFNDPDKFADKAFPTTRHTEVFEFDADYIRKAGDGSGEENRARIAKAARVTSSFPAAFPPQFTKSPSFPEESRKLYHNQKADPLSFWYYDGGVLDNKPLGHAIDYMESNSDDGQWWYFFVDPDPESDKKKHEEWGTDPKNPPDPATTAASVLETRGAETIYYDLRRIQRINHQVEQIKDLTANLWSALCDERHDGEQRRDGLLASLEQSVKTARIHRFLPDYLKCTAMLRYRFIKKLSQSQVNSLERLQKKVTDSIRAFDLRRTIAECRLQIAEGKIPARQAAEARIRLIAKSREIETGGVMADYETAVKSASDIQQRFRQIAYWVEDDFDGGKGELNPETWNAFTTAGDDLELAMDALKNAYDVVEQVIMRIIDDASLFHTLTCYVLLSEAIHASSGVETRGKINVVKIYHNKDKGRLAGSQLGHFSGFLDRRWRRNDYLMGMIDTRDMLQGKMAKSFPEEFWKEYLGYRTEQERGIPAKYRFDEEKDKLDEKDMKLENLPAAPVVSDVNGVLSTFEKLITKYSDKNMFFKIARRTRVGLFSKIVRFFLWLVKWATARTSAEDLQDGSKMSQLVAGAKRYLGFMLIGILIGLALSFFLPDAFGRGAQALSTAYQNLSHAWKSGVNVLIGLLIAFILRDTLRDSVRYLWNGIRKMKKM
ncbi:MAG: DUF3376 domain-containing protein [Betaproteobacteria bacterium]